MPAFEYKAVTPSGEIITDVIESANRQAVSREIFKKGYRPIAIRERKSGDASGASDSAGGSLNINLFAKKIKTEEIVLFTKELVTLLKAGVPMLTAIEALASQSSKEFGVVLNKIYLDVMAGKSFSQALDMHPKVFSKLYVSSVYAGEMSGSLDDVLDRMAVVLKHEEETKNKVKSAMKYPIMVTAAMIAAFAIIMTMVVPKFTAIFDSMNMDLPLPTKMLIFLSDVFQNYFLYIIIVVGAIAGGLFYFINTPKGRFWWDDLRMKIPLIGPLMTKSSMARFTKMFETLNRSGLPILQTLQTVSGAVGNTVIEKTIKDVALGVEKGQGISGSMKKYSLFPPMVVRMIAIGEQSGSLDDMQESVANHYDVEVEYAINGLTQMIEPILTLVMGGAGGILATGIFLPMWNMVGAIK